MKIPPKARKEFEFLSTTPLDMIGNDIGIPCIVDPDGVTAIEAWYAKDAQGKQLACAEPELLAKAFRSKKSWNLQIRLWAADVAQGPLALGLTELHEYCIGLPEWIERATTEQAKKIAINNVGFIPSFLSALKL